MKAYAIVEQGYEYNDESYSMPENETTVQSAYRNQEKAQDHVDRLNGKHLRENPEVVDYDNVPLVIFKLVEIDVQDEPIERAPTPVPMGTKDVHEAMKAQQQRREQMHAAQFIPQFSIAKTATYEDAKTQLVKLQEQFSALSKQTFDIVSRKIFADHPILRTYSWSQCTPYFNDGDECRFSANTDYIQVCFMDDTMFEDFCTWEANKTDTARLDEKQMAAISCLELLKKFDNDEFKQMFGDHIQVTVGRNGVETTHYEHE